MADRQIDRSKPADLLFRPNNRAPTVPGPHWCSPWPNPPSSPGGQHDMRFAVDTGGTFTDLV
ncbi:MAG: hypothetical protein RIB84_26360, partial [Sneathiellaceae bacterium]